MLSSKRQDLSNFIHPTAVIDPSAQLGENNYFGPYCVVGKNVVVGNNNRFEAFCSIGTAPEHKDFWHGEHAAVTIGNDCVIREYVTINAGTEQNTWIGNEVICLRGSHVGHDCKIYDKVTLSCNALVGGSSTICKGANLGLNATLHQYSLIGHYAMVGMATVVTKKSVIEPFKVYAGNPAKFLRLNEVGMKRNGLTVKDMNLCNDEFISLQKTGLQRK